MKFSKLELSYGQIINIISFRASLNNALSVSLTLVPARFHGGVVTQSESYCYGNYSIKLNWREIGTDNLTTLCIGMKLLCIVVKIMSIFLINFFLTPPIPIQAIGEEYQFQNTRFYTQSPVSKDDSGKDRRPSLVHGIELKLKYHSNQCIWLLIRPYMVYVESISFSMSIPDFSLNLQ